MDEQTSESETQSSQREERRGANLSGRERPEAPHSAEPGPRDDLGRPCCGVHGAAPLPKALGLEVELVPARRVCGLGVQLRVK